METNNKRKALGKGLEQLFNSEPMSFDTFEQEIVNETKEKDILEIPISEIRPNPYQPRTYFDPEALQELAESIRLHGIIEPIIVKKSIHGYELVAGERRTKAAKIAGKATIPAIIKEFSDQEMMDIAILENIQREDLTPLELAEGFQKYIENSGLTQEEVAVRFGKSRSYITNLLGLLTLPKQVREMINKKELSASHARVLSKIDDRDLIITLANQVVKDGLSVRELEKLCTMKTLPKRKPINRVRIRPVVYNSYENTLRDKLGCKVQVSKDKITIPFDSDGDLARIFEILNIDVEDEY
jgi:ParB family transcriptional regulator, chromosome partitioning protein